jgi:CoA:oxalate CoA-transferase
MSLPLDGVRVLDLGISTAGPYCARFLADLGAEVTKIEPLDGENARSLGLRYGDAGYLFHVNNYNKRSLTLKVQEPAGRELFLELVSRSDVVVENFAAGTMTRWGIGYDACRAANPSIVYCSAKGFGETGALRDRRAFDTVVQGLAGLMDATGDADSAPLKGGPSVCDLMTAAASAMACVAAIVSRVPGESTFVDTALFDMGAWSLMWLWPHAEGAAQAAERIGNRHPEHAPFGAYACSDGSLFVSVTGDEAWSALAGRLGLDADWTTAERKRRESEIDAALGAWLAPQRAWEAAATLQEAGVTATPVLALDDVAALPTIGERELITSIDHPHYGRIPLIRSPLAVADIARPPVRRLPPMLGEHTQAIVGDELGRADALDALRAAGVVGR